MDNANAERLSSGGLWKVRVSSDTSCRGRAGGEKKERRMAESRSPPIPAAAMPENYIPFNAFSWSDSCLFLHAFQLSASQGLE